MHQRKVVAAGRATPTDALHSSWVAIIVSVMVLGSGFAADMGNGFQFFTATGLFGYITYGTLAGMELQVSRKIGQCRIYSKR